MTDKKRRNDIIFIAAVILIAAIALACLLFFRGEGNTVSVTVDKELYGQYPLNKDDIIEIKTEYGRNLLIIANGKASISEASCPDLVCVHHLAVSKQGEQIICLPNRVVVSIE